MEAVISVIIALVLFAIKNWADIVDVKKAVDKTRKKWVEIHQDDRLTSEEKEEFANQVMDTFNEVVPVFTSIWKFNWKKKRKLKDLIGD